MLKTNPAIKELKNLLNCEKTVSTRISKQVKSFGFHCTNYLLGKATKKLKCPKHPSKHKMETGPMGYLNTCKKLKHLFTIIT